MVGVERKIERAMRVVLGKLSQGQNILNEHTNNDCLTHSR